MSKFSQFLAKTLNEPPNRGQSEMESLYEISSSSLGESTYQDAMQDSNASSKEVQVNLMDSKLEDRLDLLSQEILCMKATMLSYRKCMAEINEDIIEVYSYMYDIYKRFEKEDEMKDRVQKRESPEEVHGKLTDNKDPSVNQKRLEGGRGSQTESLKRAEKRQFLRNMLSHKKSDFTINLNRNNVFFPELKKILMEKKRLTRN